jgi:hypothetical protein
MPLLFLFTKLISVVNRVLALIFVRLCSGSRTPIVEQEQSFTRGELKIVILLLVALFFAFVLLNAHMTIT